MCTVDAPCTLRPNVPHRTERPAFDAEGRALRIARIHGRCRRCRHVFTAAPAQGLVLGFAGFDEVVFWVQVLFAAYVELFIG